MRIILRATLTVLLLLSSAPADAQDARATLDAATKALGAANLKSYEMTASGVSWATGQSPAPGSPWPRFVVKNLTRSVNYETASLRDVWVRTQGEDPPRGGGVQPVRGEQRQVFVVAGDLAWNVVNDAAIPAPITLAARQLELWATPHGVVKAARANNATVQGRTLAFAVPGRFTVRATLNRANLVERVEAVIPNPVLGDIPVTVEYADYKDVGGVKFPMRITQTAGGFPTLDLTVAEVRPSAAVDVAVPDNVRAATAPYAVVTTQMVAEGVWYLTGGTHHSVAIEMADHLIVVEAPLNDERALAVLKEARGLAPGKPVRYVINSHHHFDHSGGLRAFAARSTISPDHLARSGKKAAATEGVRDKRVLTDGTRSVEIHHVAGILHDDGMLLVYLPKEKLLIEADAYTPTPPNTPPPSPPSPFNVALVDNIARLGLTVDRLLPLHGRIVPLADLLQAAGRAN
ncbi:MAG: MBL fold metallo-hydrolase [Candidatus Rokuibacteriota bacterium]|nr:MAG: MBL fold metallo-hydrolase [Candidatus Rokubacteria bacterium]